MVTHHPGGWVETVLDLWFRQLDPKAWFTKSDATDAMVRKRGLAIHEQLARQLPPETREDACAALAAVIALDQFPRNMFRGTPRAFATDALALDVAKHGIERGLDKSMSKTERQFFYLPLEHCEGAGEQAQCVALFAELDDPELTRYATAHKVIIDRFGRFPHRNEILGRASTPEELEFLKQPGSAF